jgi:hypothetical protein
MHTDSADVTVNIALSDPADYSGGGTYFESIDEVCMSSTTPTPLYSFMRDGRAPMQQLTIVFSLSFSCLRDY